MNVQPTDKTSFYYNHEIGKGLVNRQAFTIIAKFSTSIVFPYTVPGCQCTV